MPAGAGAGEVLPPPVGAGEPFEVEVVPVVWLGLLVVDAGWLPHAMDKESDNTREIKATDLGKTG